VSSPLLEIRELVVAFDAFHAVDRLDLSLHEHEVRFVIGPNGAGRSNGSRSPWSWRSGRGFSCSTSRSPA
jgi:ABC-type phosphate transport system ATPase subunit